MKKNITFITIFIGLLFFLITSQYLSWEYILYNYYSDFKLDLIGQFLGEFFQGMGMLFFCIYLHFCKNRPTRITEFSTLMALDFILSVFAIATASKILCLIFGFFMNISIGSLYAWYVCFIIDIVPQKSFGLAFGLGNAIACSFSYILYLADKNHLFVTSSSCLYFYAIITLVLFILMIKNQSLIHNPFTEDYTKDSTHSLTPQLLGLAILFILFVNIVHGLGYYLPNQDTISANISIEAMRIFYAISLIIVGLLIDNNRRLGLILCLVALAFSFSMPLLHQSLAGIYMVWIITYLTSGIISVYRVVTFLDISVDTRNIAIAPVGLLLGRIGYPLGELIRAYIGSNNTLILIVISIFYALTIVFASALISKSSQYNIATSATPVDYHAVFTEKYNLSAREIQILDELLALHSNKEIAASLYITEATVKFHVKNLMKKTGCKNRNELIKLYNNK